MKSFNRPYVRNWNRFFTPIYIQNEVYSLYFNFNVNDADFINFRLWVIKPDGTHVANIGMLYRVIVDSGGVNYHIYHPGFSFPFIPNGQYYFQIYDQAYGREVLRSNLILVHGDYIYNSCRVKFRHNDQLYGVRYDLLEDFWQMYRVPICQIKNVEVRSERQQYRESSNGRWLRNSKSFRDLVFTMEFYWADDIDFQAVSAMLEHTDIYISRNKIIDMTQIRIEKPSELSRLSKGTFDVIVDDFNLNPNEPENYGEFILCGGSPYADFSKTLIKGN